jgi:hypothetical protein
MRVVGYTQTRLYGDCGRYFEFGKEKAPIFVGVFLINYFLVSIRGDAVKLLYVSADLYRPQGTHGALPQTLPFQRR